MFPQRIPKESKSEKSLLFSEKEPQRSVVSFFFKKERTRAEFVATLWGCSSVGRAPALQAGGQEFESLHLHESRRDKSSVHERADLRDACERGSEASECHDDLSVENVPRLRRK